MTGYGGRMLGRQAWASSFLRTQPALRSPSSTHGGAHSGLPYRMGEGLFGDRGGFLSQPLRPQQHLWVCDAVAQLRCQQPGMGLVQVFPCAQQPSLLNPQHQQHRAQPALSYYRWMLPPFFQSCLHKQKCLPAAPPPAAAMPPSCSRIQVGLLYVSLPAGPPLATGL